ncbi:hypothetical protein GUJ93_ZPchr0007g5303 [Zizania palustris]|uniref:Uncharacterized protein n=1 Tax=Zizania palustris TaxID=103762 RepID=A0A8J5W6C6_ZIZPA|nr:hypothetical protein GUJ93_ZPchr0007g5303 [Zizania palustris]
MDRLAALLELAAADDVDVLKAALAEGGEAVVELADGVGLWYGRSKAYEPRTPLMVAATYGSAGVVSLLVSLGCVDVNRRPGVDGATALHCAASGGSRNAVAVVKLLLAADALGDLEVFLGRRRALAVATSVASGSSSPPLSSSPDEGNRSPSSRSSSLSPITVDRVKKEYPVDPTLPDIKSSVYASDEFRMFAFKSWLHPSQYRTRLCKEGTACARRICFFAHDEDELRHVPYNSGAGLLSPRASSSIDMTSAAGMLGLIPGSPTRHFVPPPVSPSAGSNGGAAAAAHWLQGSRLRSSFNARDAAVDDIGMLLEWESQYLGALSLPPSSRSQPRLSTGLSIRPTIASSNLEDMFASDMAMSPRFPNDQGHSVYSPAHKSALLNKLHQQKGLLSPVNTNRMYSPRALDPSTMSHSPFGVMSPRSPHAMDSLTSPLSAHVGALATQQEMYEHFSSLNKHQLPSVGSPRNSVSWGTVGSPMGKVDWGMNGEELVRLRRPTQPRFGEVETDVSWMQPLVSHAELNGKKNEIQGTAGTSALINRTDLNNQGDLLDQTVIGAWLEQMHLDKK